MQGLIKDLITRNDSKIVFIVLDGLGGLPIKGKTELESADIPNMDKLARLSACGLHVPVGMGITPGSGPGHFSLFGYDPIEFQIGRGILEALGLGIDVKDTDIAVRCNYATTAKGIIVDRRAGRIPTEQNIALTERLKKKIKNIDDVEVIFKAGMEHRFALVLRFPLPLPKGSASINDTDPQKEGKPPILLKPATEEAKRVTAVAEKAVSQIVGILKDEAKANYILLRGFSQKPAMPSFMEAYGLKALAIAIYPMYRGLAKLVGMDAPKVDGDLKEQIGFLASRWNDYDFFFLHVKKPDSYGEDGNFQAKAKKIEDFDKAIPGILKLNPDVLIITGDHCTPSLLKSHSWHPVPVLVKSPYVLGGLLKAYSERECVKGELGIFPTTNLMPFALANAGRLKKFGA